MSAIWGCVDLSGGELPEGLEARMEAPFRERRIDRFSARRGEGAVMGGGVQFFTDRAKKEALPLLRGSGLLFTADCVIDNRAELTAALCPVRGEIPDGELLLLAYEKWGDDAPAHVYGTYAFAAWQPGERRLLLAADHTSSRCLFYAQEGERVYFSTLMEPILLGMERRPPVSERWIAGYLSASTLLMTDDPESTCYDGIKKCAPPIA